VGEPSPELRDGDLVLHGRVMPASNATFVGEVCGTTVVYKPIAGERPLWDFPDGTLADRERGAYLVSEAFGWDVVPLTFLRDGPHGLGMVQLWQEPAEGEEAVTIVRSLRERPGWLHVFDGVDERDHDVALVHEDSTALRRMAVFDAVVNNADRKGGHVLAMADGHRYGVDHGVSFHVEDKLRTVLWGWAGDRLDPEDRVAVAALGEQVRDAGTGAGTEVRAEVAALRELLAPEEVATLARRCLQLVRRGRMPVPSGSWPSIPWPAF
jgi:uncharacterized repeat protein (TIGR03843 family)